MTSYKFAGNAIRGRTADFFIRNHAWGTNNDGQLGVGQVLRHEVEYKVTHPRVAHSGWITVYGATDAELRERAKVAIVERIKYGVWRFVRMTAGLLRSFEFAVWKPGENDFDRSNFCTLVA